MIRTLRPGDEARLDAFLEPLTDTSMFLLANLRAGGLQDEGRPFQGTYVGAFHDDVLVAVAAHWWNGIISVQAPVELEGTVAELARASTRRVAGIVGPLEQVQRAKVALGLANAPVNLDSIDVLYALELSQLRVPPALRDGTVNVRRASPDDVPLITGWNHDFRVEALGEKPGPVLREAAAQSVRQQLGRRTLFLAVADGTPVATAMFNAALADCVQLGGVWTPVPLRSRGYARIVTAGALQLAAAEGVTRSVLFTQESNAPARRAYEALGYTDRGRFALVLYAAQ